MLDAEENILMLASDHDLALLHASYHWVADGNFNYQSPMFVQLYAIHDFCNTECKAAVHILMANRRLSHYFFALVSTLHTLTSHYISLGGRIILDFEQAAMRPQVHAQTDLSRPVTTRFPPRCVE